MRNGNAFIMVIKDTTKILTMVISSKDSYLNITVTPLLVATLSRSVMSYWMGG